MSTIYDQRVFEGARGFSARGRAFVDRSAVPIYAVIAAGAGFIGLVCAATDFAYDPASLNGTALALLLFAVIAMGARWASFPRLATTFESMVLLTMMAFMAPLCAVIMASTNLPLADAMLNRADALFFGFQRQPLVDAVEEWPLFMSATRSVYHSLLGQPYLLILLLGASGQMRRLWTLVFARGVALGITLAVFPFFPAVGAPPYFFDFLPVVEGARDGSLRVLTREAFTGIITFPSFHAAAAVLLAWGYRTVRIVGPFFVGLNVLMFGSALIAGHYLIDLIAGGAVAWLAITIAKRFYAVPEVLGVCAAELSLAASRAAS